ncbi:MAG: hypothetical protein M1820_010185 [Bogoriella megaspora]|nr:MAG: hypothetical protein M1820_010185 [Bogoriella megaspora]
MTDNLDLNAFHNEDWATHISVVEESIESTESQHVPSQESREESDVAIADNIAQYIDHTQLKTDATLSQIDQLCKEASDYQFKTVCVRLDHVRRCVTALNDASVGIACVIGFHEGTHPTASKIVEAQSALQAGASELDIVLNYPLLLSSSPQYSAVYFELQELRKAAGVKATLKLIIETSQLERSQIIAACTLAHAAGFDFVKTSTGFKGHGAKVEDVRLMKRVVGFLDQREGKGRKTQVKASGGVKTWADSLAMIRAGATRIGASSGMAIVKEARSGNLSEKGNANSSGGY